MQSFSVSDILASTIGELPMRCSMRGDLASGYGRRSCYLIPAGVDPRHVPQEARIVIKHPGIMYTKDVDCFSFGDSAYLIGTAEVVGELTHSEVPGCRWMLQNLESLWVESAGRQSERVHVDLSKTGLVRPEEIEEIATNPHLQDWEKKEVIDDLLATRKSW